MAEQRTGRIHLNPTATVAALRLPEGTKLRTFIPSYDPLGLDIVVEHPDFDPVPPGAESPRFGTRTVFDRGELVSIEWIEGPSYTTVIDEPIQEPDRFLTEPSDTAPYCQAAVIVRRKDTDELSVFALDHARIEIRGTDQRPGESGLVLHGTLDPKDTSAHRAAMSLRQGSDTMRTAETSYVREVLSAMIRFVKRGMI